MILACRHRAIPTFFLAAMGVLLVVARLSASDGPHWYSQQFEIGCEDCHTGHQAQGSQLTAAATNLELCNGCHNQSGLADGLPVNGSDSAVPGVSGTSHPFDVAAVNNPLNITRPTDTQMDLRVMDDNIVCSTCHNQHSATSTNGGTPRISDTARTTALESTGDVQSGGTFSGAQGVWFLIEIVQNGSETGARFCYSKDNAATWFPIGCDPEDPSPSTFLTALGSTAVSVGDGVEVTFDPGNFVDGERWEFYASYPFLRRPMGADGSAFCLYCHDPAAWSMDTAAVNNYDGNPKSHPIGISLPATQDFHNPPLDAHGVAQGGVGDGNTSNDLQLFSGNVGCLSCHGMHYTDSNSLTEDIQ